jgi:uncharacterized membrane protein
MRVENKSPAFKVASAVFNLLNPIPFGLFVAVMIFDFIYANTGEVLWVKSAAWLVSLGLIIAILPRLINLGFVWFGKNRTAPAVKLDFWLNLVAVVTALVNAFVHSRDAYAAIPDAVYLSVVTVVLMAIGRIVLAWQNIGFKEYGHE